MIGLVAADLDDIVTKVAQLGVPLGGVFLVLRLVMAFQRDFAERYAARVAGQEATIDQLHADIDRLRQLLYEANRALVAAGVSPVWGGSPRGDHPSSGGSPPPGPG